MKRSLRSILGYRWLDSVSSGPPCVHVTSLSPPEYQSQVCASILPLESCCALPAPPPIYGLHGGSSGTRMGALEQESSKVKYIPVPCFFFLHPPSLQLQWTCSDSDSDSELKRTLETGSQFYLKDDKILQFCTLNDFFLSQLKIMRINVKLNEKKRKISPSLLHVVRQLFLLYSG